MDSDNQLMKKVKEGDREAYEALVLKYRESAIRFANSFLSNLHTAEDVTQEVFVNIYLMRDSYKLKYPFKNFLFTSIRNQAIDYLRKHKGESLFELKSEWDKNAIDFIENWILEEDKKTHIAELLSCLKGDGRTALYLFAVENMSYKEIGQVMKKNIGQVKILVFRSRKKLKKLSEGGKRDEK